MSADPRELIEAYLDGELSPEQERELEAWLAADPEHLKTFVRETHAHGQLRMFFKAEAADSAPEIEFGAGMERFAGEGKATRRGRTPSSRKRMIAARTARRRAGNRSYWAPTLLAACLLVGVVLYVVLQDAGLGVSPQAAAGKVIEVTYLTKPDAPKAYLLRDGEKRELRAGEELLAGDVVRTESGASGMGARPFCAALELHGATFDLADGTEIELPAMKARGVGLAEGLVYVDAPASLTLMGEVAEVTVQTAARFEFSHKPGQARVRVESGSLRLGNAKGTRELAALEACTAYPNRMPEKPSAFAAADLWRGRLGPLKPAVATAKPGVAVAAVQLPVAGERAGADVNRVKDAVAQAKAQGASLVVLPALAFYPQALDAKAVGPHLADDGELQRTSSELARAHGIYLAVGFYTRETGGAVYNSALLFGPDGQELLRQHKNVRAGNESDFCTAGNGFRSADTPLGRIGMVISKDVYANRAWHAQFKQDGVNLLLVLNNDDAIERYYEQLAPFATECQAHVLMANSASRGLKNLAAVIPPEGEVLRSAPGAVVLLGQVPPKGK